MRGLTPIERHWLARRAHDAPRAFVRAGSPEHMAHNLLATQQRIIKVPIDEIDDEGRRLRWRSHITDLGRLALRVCPVEEA